MKPPDRPTGEAAHLQAPTVLIVDDEWIVRKAIAEYLRNCGYRVIEASNAHEAIAALSEDARINVVFSDVKMPGSIDGFGLAQWVRRARPEIKIILTSGVVRAVEAAGDLCDGGPLMTKPYSHTELERRIRVLLADH